MDGRCERCGTRLTGGRKRWCSMACARTSQLIPCAMCGKIVSRAPNQLAKNARTFCSRKCLGAWQRLHQRRYIPNVGRFMQWSPELAYFLGLFTADGNVQTETGQVSFVSTDLSNTQFVADFLAEGVPIRTSLTAAGRTAYRMSLWSKNVADELARYGVTDRKSFTARIPVMPFDLSRHYLRGLIDGDGYVAPDGRIEIGTASRGMASDLSGLLDRLELPYRNVNSKRQFFRISLRKGPSALLAQMMYRDGGPCLERKRERLLRPS